MEYNSCFSMRFPRSQRSKLQDRNAEEQFRINNLLKPIPAEVLGHVLVQLYKREGSNLGLTVSGGADRGEAPVIASIRPGSIADRSDCLLANDNILAINGIETISLKHEEIVRLVRNSGPHILLEVEYQLPDNPTPIQTAHAKRTQVTLERDGGENFGFIVRGGAAPEPQRSRSINVMHVRPGSSAERDGRVRAGDRILAINGRPTEEMTCEEAMGHMRSTEFELQLFIEYDVAKDGSATRSCPGPVTVDVHKRPSERLGISLAPYHDQGSNSDIFYIDNIREGSIADRCGLLQLGDKVIGIDDFKVDNMTLQEAMHRIKSNVSETIRLEIIPDNSFDPDKMPVVVLPVNSIPRAKSMPSGVVTCNGPQIPQNYLPSNVNPNQCSCQMGACISVNHQPEAFMANHSHSDQFAHHNGYNCSGGHPGNVPNNNNNSGPMDANCNMACPGEVMTRSSMHQSMVVNSSRDTTSGGALIDMATKRQSLVKSTTSLYSACAGSAGLNRGEKIEVTLTVDDMGSFGFTLKGLSHTPTAPLTEFPVVEYVQPGGPAYHCSVIQEGDRLLSVNQVPTVGRSLDEVNSQILSCGRNVTLLIQFDVSDSVVPTAGIFNVKLVKFSESLGINLQAVIGAGQRNGQPLLVTKVTPGGVAYRSGSIHAGDLLLAINNVPTESCSLGEAVILLQDAEEVVTLRIQKEDRNSTVSMESEPASTFQVELIRSALDQPWGIVISGREDVPAPPYVFVDSLTPGGPAHVTGQIVPGDLILGINQLSLNGRTLGQVREVLQQQHEKVTLTLLRPSLTAQGKSDSIGSGSGRKMSSKAKVQTTPRLGGLSSFNDMYTAKKRNMVPQVGGYPSMIPTGRKIPSTDSAVDLPDQPTTESDSDSQPPRTSRGGPLPLGTTVSPAITMTTSCHAGAMATTGTRPLSLYGTSFDHQQGQPQQRTRVVSGHEPPAPPPRSSLPQTQHHHAHQNACSTTTIAVTATGTCQAHPQNTATNHNHGPNSNGGQCPGCWEAMETELRQKQQAQLMRIQQQQQALHQQLQQHEIQQQQKLQQEQQRSSLLQRTSCTLPKVHGGAIPITIPSHATVRQNKAANRISQPNLPSTVNGEQTETGNSDSGSPHLRSTGNGTLFRHRTIDNGDGSSPVMIRNTDQQKVEGSPAKISVRLNRNVESETFGIGVSDGVSPKGVFISAVRPNTPAQRSGQIQVYDRILKVNNTNVEELSCSDVVTLISRSGKQLDLILQRKAEENPNAIMTEVNVPLLKSSTDVSNAAENKNSQKSSSNNNPVTQELYVNTSTS